jgi:DnaK suppressor protein
MMAMDYRKIKQYLEHERTRFINELAACNQLEFDKSYEHGILNKIEELSTLRLEMERQIAKMKRIEKQLVEIDRALEKIKRGIYGLCDRCGQQIPVARLEAVPHTGFCLNCKGNQPG